MTQQVQFGTDPAPSAAPNQPTVDDQGNLVTPQETPSTPEGAAPADRPEWLPENFQSPEDLAKSYREAQAELTRLRQAAKQEAPKEAPKGEESTSTESVSDPDDDGLSFEEAAAKWVESGAEDLSDEDYTFLEEAGYSRQFVDTYLRGLKAEAEGVASTVYEIAGGEEKYSAMTQWAAANLSKQEVDAFNKVVDSGSPQEIALAVRGLKAQYAEKNGQAPSRSVTGGNARDGAGGFQSLEQQIAAQSDPRYAADPAYRADVEAKIRNSNFW